MLHSRMLSALYRGQRCSSSAAPLLGGLDLSGFGADGSSNNQAAPATPKGSHGCEYDLAVIGGGSGGYGVLRISISDLGMP